MPLVYIEKGLGLHDAIAAAGFEAYWSNGQFITPNPSDEPAIQAIIDAYAAPDMLAAAKAERSRAVALHAKALRDKAMATISAAEMASWPIKRAEAQAYASLGDGACPTLAVEALARGVTLAALVDKVNTNAVACLMLETAVAGTDGRHRDAIAALDSIDAVLAYEYSSGWPEV